MDSFKLARNVENVFFPSNVGIVAGLVLILYLSVYDSALFMNNLVLFVISVIAFILLVGFTKSVIKSETKKYTTAALVAILAFIIGSFFIEASTQLLLCFYSILIATTVYHFIRDKWKISGHMGAYTGVCTILSLIDYRFLPVFVFLPLVAWSRLKLKRHTTYKGSRRIHNSSRGVI